jgi:hypothetical protein
MGALIDKPLGTVKISGGSAGTPGGSVTSVQGVSGGTPVPVDVALAAAPIDGTKTVTTAGTRVILAASAQGFKVGTYVTNTHATAIVYVGSSSVSSSRFIVQLYPGQTTPLLPFDPSVINIDSNTNGATTTWGGG